MDPTKTYSFAMAMADYFGKKPSQTTADFVQELKALDDSDRAYFREALSEIGYKLQ